MYTLRSGSLAPKAALLFTINIKLKAETALINLTKQEGFSLRGEDYGLVYPFQQILWEHL